jgi:hypothetical protein
MNDPRHGQHGSYEDPYQETDERIDRDLCRLALLSILRAFATEGPAKGIGAVFTTGLDALESTSHKAGAR